MQQVTDILNSGAATAAQSSKAKAQDKGEMGQQDFMKLLVAQLENQDPTKPMDNFQFLSQIAQFGMVDGIQNLEQTFGNVADSFRQSQVIEATSLLGRKVMAEGGSTWFDGMNAVEGEIDIPGRASGVVLEVRDQTGRLIRSSGFTGDLSGSVSFGWDGADQDGNVVPAGQYQFSARGLVDGKSREFELGTMNAVDSLTVESSGAIALTLANGEVTDLGDVSRFR